MTKSKVCSVAGCFKPKYLKGFCSIHYHRDYLHGSPTGGGSYRTKAIEYLRDVVLPYRGKDCLIWPFGVSIFGYGRIMIGGRNKTVARLACEHRHGPPPTPKHQAAHSCGNGAKACVSPKHVRWATVKENAEDRILHGTVPRGENCHLAKLTEKQVIAMRKSYPRLSLVKISKKYGVTIACIHSIIRRKTWVHI